MNVFLKIKHWQLFILMFIIPFGLQFLAMCSLIFGRGPYLFPLIFPLVILLYAGVFFGWLYSTGTNLHKKLPETVSMKLGKFKLFLCIPTIYITLIMVTISIVFRVPEIGHISPSVIPLFILIILPLHLFSIFCIFYCLYFVAKSLKAVEVQQPVTFNDYSGEFFLTWFFFIGVWFIQPRINKLFEDTGQE